MNRRLPFFLVLTVSAALSAQAEIYRCAGARGAVSYQEIPCDAAEQGSTVKIPSQYPEVNSAERNRLLQREAAMDARLLERMRIESAERIAQAELATREREAKAAREAAEAAAQQYGYPVFVTGPVYRGPRVQPHQVLRRGSPQRL